MDIEKIEQKIDDINNQIEETNKKNEEDELKYRNECYDRAMAEFCKAGYVHTIGRYEDEPSIEQQIKDVRYRIKHTNNYMEKRKLQQELNGLQYKLKKR